MAAPLRQRIIDHFEKSMVEAELVIPYAKQALIAEVSESFDESGRKLVIRALPGALARLQQR